MVSKVGKKGLLSLPTKLHNYSTQIQYDVYMDRQFTGHYVTKFKDVCVQIIDTTDSTMPLTIVVFVCHES